MCSLTEKVSEAWGAHVPLLVWAGVLEQNAFSSRKVCFGDKNGYVLYLLCPSCCLCCRTGYPASTHLCYFPLLICLFGFISFSLTGVIKTQALCILASGSREIIHLDSGDLTSREE